MRRPPPRNASRSGCWTRSAHQLGRMTLRELLGDGPDDVEISGLAYDNRPWCPARCSSASPASRATATTSRPTRSPAGRSRWSSRARSASACPRSWWPTCAPRWRSPPRASTATRPPTLRVSASPAPTARRRPRSSRARCWRRAGRRCGLLGTVKSVVVGRRGHAGAHDAGGDRPPAHVPRDARRRRRRVRDGDLLARALAHRADAIHVAAAIFTNLNQDHLDFHPDDGGLLPGQAAAVRVSAARRADRERRRRRTAAA